MKKIELADGLWARFEFEGDLFEMEDQRNWTDASFKTYSTPISLGWPHRAQAGQEIRQPDDVGQEHGREGQDEGGEAGWQA